MAFSSPPVITAILTSNAVVSVFKLYVKEMNVGFFFLIFLTFVCEICPCVQHALFGYSLSLLNIFSLKEHGKIFTHSVVDSH